MLGQGAANQLIRDIEANVLAPAMLFQGPPASAKGTTALELGRIISCEAEASGTGGRAPWSCRCPACLRHRILIHPDLLCLGPKSFSSEIAASAAAFLRETGTEAARLLFIRSIRKLLARFNPVLWEDEPKGAKVFPLVNSLEEGLDELGSLEPNKIPSLPKLVEGLQKDAYKLESEGMAETIPIGQLRRAASWSHLAPTGRAKLLIIENADHMQDEARNSLLKLLEEPPVRFHCVLTSCRPGSLIPTIVSRLRPYRFSSRDAAVEAEVIRRVFRTEHGSAEHNSPGMIGAYLDSFLPVSGAVLDGLAALFAASVAYKAVLISKKQEQLLPRPLPEAAVLLGKYAAPKAEEAGFGRPLGNAGELAAKILEKAGNFEIRSLFSRFLCCLLEQVSNGFKCGEPSSFLPGPEYNEMWKKCINWAGTAALTYKLRPVVVLEKLFTDLSRGMADL